MIDYDEASTQDNIATADTQYAIYSSASNNHEAFCQLLKSLYCVMGTACVVWEQGP